MIYYKSGDIFESTADALVNTVNTEGIMGKGLALQFKKKFPENFKAYVKACKNKDVVIGKIFPYIENSFSSKKVILNFPTKISWT